MKEVIWFLVLPMVLLITVWEGPRRAYKKLRDLPDWVCTLRFIGTLVVVVMWSILTVMVPCNRVEARNCGIQAVSLQQDLTQARLAQRDLELAAIMLGVTEFNSSLRQRQYWAVRFPMLWGSSWSDIELVK